MPTILVVDDDAHILEVVQYALERDGFIVETAQNGAEGLKTVEIIEEIYKQTKI